MKHKTRARAILNARPPQLLDAVSVPPTSVRLCSCTHEHASAWTRRAGQLRAREDGIDQSPLIWGIDQSSLIWEEAVRMRGGGKCGKRACGGAPAPDRCGTRTAGRSRRPQPPAGSDRGRRWQYAPAMRARGVDGSGGEVLLRDASTRHPHPSHEPGADVGTGHRPDSRTRARQSDTDQARTVVGPDHHVTGPPPVRFASARPSRRRILRSSEIRTGPSLRTSGRRRIGD